MTEAFWRGVLTAMAVDAVLLAAALAWTGCSTTQAHPEAQAPSACTGTVDRASVHVGVSTGVPAGECPGADRDARTAAAWCADGRPQTIILDGQATIAAVKRAVEAHARSLRPGGKLVVTLASHGTQRKDASGDEADGLDEGICLDSIWWDDDIAAWVRATLPPIRIEFVTDCCHAEANWRTLWLGGRRGPLVVALDYPRGWDGELIQAAACREGESALGSALGGAFHNALDATPRDGRTFTQWATAAAAKVAAGGQQTPVLVEYNVSPEFRASQALR